MENKAGKVASVNYPFKYFKQGEGDWPKDNLGGSTGTQRLGSVVRLLGFKS